MLYLKSMSIRNFKSIKSSELLFSKGFTCIVGPNGSGKSNICDALLFGLGENALHRLRVDKLENLINDSSKSKKNVLQKAAVKIEFDGDKSIELIRIARSDGKSAYRLNGKRMTRQEVLDELRAYKLDANETNTITQGEIAKLLELSPKERRELIEISAGIKEFEDKKKEALKELEKANIKVGEAKIMLNERMGFLQELEKEKLAAEKYLSMSARYKALNYSVLVGKEKLVRSELEELDKSIKELEEKKKKIEGEISEYNSKISELSLERQNLTKALSESTAAVGETNKRLEIANSEIVRINVELEGLGREKENIAKRLEELSREEEDANNKIKSNMQAISEIRAELAKIKIPDAIGEGQELDFEKKLGDLDGKISEMEKRLQEKGVEISKAQAELYVASSRYDLLKAELAKKPEANAPAGKEIEEINAELSKLAIEEKQLAEELNGLNKRKDELDSKLLNLKEQRAMSRQSDSIDALSKFGEKDGFYGKASKLLSYPNEYAYAIEAAAGNRLDYFVVESIDVANRLIKYLRENRLGRATFIPINELVVGKKEKVPGLRQVVELVQYEKKFEKVFQYIFFDTYLVDDINDAKRYGIGHRYVTLEGDIVEQSGVVSGGLQKKLSINALERMIEQVSIERDNVSKLIEEKISRLSETRKGLALAKMKLEEKESELKKAKDLMEKERKEYGLKLSEKESLEKSIEAMNEKLSSLLSEQEALRKEVDLLRGERAKLYEESMELAKAALHSTSKKEREKIEQERKRGEELKIKMAGLEKENELLASRLASISNELASKKKELKDKISLENEKQAKAKELEKEKLELEEKIKSSSGANKEIYSKLEALESEIAKQSNEVGKLSAEVYAIDSKLQEAKLRRSQLEVRLGDLRAEISVYANEKIELVEGKIEEMEREALIISDRIKELGNVNLKAPELYEERAKAVSEAKSKVEMLEAEREGVLKMIEEIDAKKYSVFMETFNAVSKNFAKLYSYISEDKAELALSDEKDPFNSELLIKLKTKDNTSKRAESLSGGERSMLMLMLVFAIHMYKPSSIYIFDEIDSALDKENSKKLSQLIKQLSADSQFIVVSHNDSLISNADAAIGVAKINNESKIFGLQVSSIISSLGAGDEKKA